MVKQFLFNQNSATFFGGKKYFQGLVKNSLNFYFIRIPYDCLSGFVHFVQVESLFKLWNPTTASYKTILNMVCAEIFLKYLIM